MELPSALSTRLSSPSRAERRTLLMKSDSCIFVDAEDYTQLAVSNRVLERADDEVARLCGLRDLNTGELFYIESERLFT